MSHIVSEVTRPVDFNTLLQGVESPLAYYRRTGSFNSERYNDLAAFHFSKDGTLGFVLSLGLSHPLFTIPSLILTPKKLGDAIYDVVQMVRTRNGRIPRSVRRAMGK